MDLARKIVNLRKDRGLWQQDLAKLCGVTGGWLSKIEAGGITPSDLTVATLVKLARALSVPIDYLLDALASYRGG